MVFVALELGFYGLLFLIYKLKFHFRVFALSALGSCPNKHIQMLPKRRKDMHCQEMVLLSNRDIKPNIGGGGGAEICGMRKPTMCLVYKIKGLFSILGKYLVSLCDMQ